MPKVLIALLLMLGGALPANAQTWPARPITMIEDPAIRKRLEELGLEILPPEQRTPEYLAKYLPQEVDRWKKVIVAAGIPIE